MATLTLAEVIFCVLGLLRGSMGLSTGAPSGACYTLTPLHSVPPQTTPPPFTVSASVNEYTSESKINVTLKSLCDEKFKGFILEARRASSDLDRNELIGTFNVIGGSRAVTDCGNESQAVTHTDAQELKSQMIFEWTAPVEETGHIVFVASFVRERVILWTHVYSAVVKAQNDGSAVNPGENIYPTVASSCPTTQPPTVAPVASIPYDEDCGKTKGCFVNCENEECRFIVSWKPGQSQIEFELAAVVEADNDKWLALGFSNDERMGDDSVIECALKNDEIQVYSSYSNWGSNFRLTGDPKEGVTKAAGSISNGVLRCSILREVDVASNAQIYDLNNEYYLMFAMGDTETASDQKQPHSLEVGKRPIVTDRKVSVQSTEEILGDGATTSSTVSITQGPLMLALCIFAASFGIVSTLG